MHDLAGNRLKQSLVVVDQQHGWLLLLQKFDQLVLVEQIQVIGRLIPQVEIGFFNQ